MQILLSFVLSIFICVSSFSQGETPAINQQIVDYVKTTIGTKVNRGECWDLAYEALTRHECMWDWEYEYGELYDPMDETVFPGDLIQFENVVVKYKKGNVMFTETMGHHTAIVYSIIDQEKKIFELAHQNTEFSGKKVGLSEFNLKQVTKGEIMFYHPVAME
jgi:hypothetical protein